MNSPAFRLSLLTLALACASGAQAATARADIARPTDFGALSVGQGPIVCQSSKVQTCGRRVAGRLGLPPGGTPKSAFRFVEEEFLFDSGVAIFLETAVPVDRNTHAGWRRRMAFRKTAEGFQLVQVGIQYRCQDGSWQKEACGPATRLARGKSDARAVAQAGGAGGRPQAGADGARSGMTGAAPQAGGKAGSGDDDMAGVLAAAGAGHGADQDGANRAGSGRAPAGQSGNDPAAGRTAGRQEEAVRVLRPDRTDAGVRSATPVESITPTEQESVPALDARWRPRQSAIEQDEAVTAAYGQKQRAARSDSQRPSEPADAARSAEASARSAELDALRRDEAIANRGLDEEDAAAAARAQQRAGRQGAAQSAASRTAAGATAAAGAAAGTGRGGTQSSRASADIVAANPSISAEQLKQMHAAEASLARATAGSAPGVVDADAADLTAGQAGDERRDGGQDGSSAQAQARQGRDRAAQNLSEGASGAGDAARNAADAARGTAAGDADAGRDAAGSAADAARGGAAGVAATLSGRDDPSGNQEGARGQQRKAASDDPDARRGWQTAVIEAAGSNNGTRVPATLPATVRTADGFAPMALSTENAAQLSRPCEQPIEMCGKQVFETLFPVQASTLAALPVNQGRRESFIYADGPVTSAVYLVTMADLPDDSIASQRIRIEFVRRGAGWVAASAGRQFKCREGDQVRQQWTDRSCR